MLVPADVIGLEQAGRYLLRCEQMTLRHIAAATVLVFGMSAGAASYGQDTNSVADLGESMNKIMASWMGMMTDPAVFQSMMQFNDPAIYNQWIGMMTNPRMVDAMMQTADPAIFRQWLDMMTDPVLVEGMTKWADPDLMNQWVDVMTSPAMMDTMMKMITPEFMRGIFDSMNNLMENVEVPAEPDGQ